MHCPGCGVTLEPGARFCGACGFSVTLADGDETISDPATPGGSPLPEDRTADELVGRELMGQYVVRSLIGVGGMGRVYLADQPSVGRQAAIKVMMPSLGRDPERSARFQREAQAAARLTSAHVVGVYNYGAMPDGTLFIAMEHLSGRTLSSVLRQGPLAPDLAVRIAGQICDALSDAHRSGIVHRDLKPSNIMLVTRDGNPNFVKVLDFGVAKLRDTHMTADGALFGTPQFMSPEQLRGDSDLDGRSDLYSVGLIVHHMLSGRPPFTANTPIAYIHQHLDVPPPPLRSLGVPVSAALEMAVLRPLSKDPAARPQTAAQLRGELEAALMQPVQPLAPGPAPPYLPGTTGMPGMPSMVAATEESSRVGAIVGAIVGVLVLGALIGGGLWWTNRADDARESADAETPEEESPNESPNAGTEGEKPAPDTPDASPKVVAPPEPPPPRPAGNLSPEAEALFAMKLPALEKKFQEVLNASLLPPSSRQQASDAYELQKRSTPAGEGHDAQLKVVLVQMINGYDQPNLKARPGDLKTATELQEVFMSMEMSSAMPENMRRMTMDQMLEGVDQMPVSDADKVYYRQIQLAGLIRSLATDPAIIDGAAD